MRSSACYESEIASLKKWIDTVLGSVYCELVNICGEKTEAYRVIVDFYGGKSEPTDPQKVFCDCVRDLINNTQPAEKLAKAHAEELHQAAWKEFIEKWGRK